jgi:integrase
VLAQQRYAKSHRILANCRDVKDFRRFRNSQDGTWFSRLILGLTQPVHPHLFRHQMITYLTSRGLSDAQIQLISGHESKKSLEIYQHLSLGAVEQAYQEAVQGVSVKDTQRCQSHGPVIHAGIPGILPLALLL